MLPPSFLDELRNRLPVSAVVGRRVKLAKAGREMQGCCPFHGEKTPSFTVNDDKGFFHCFGCGAHGDVVAFEMRVRNLSFIDAVENLADECGLEMPAASPEDRAREVRRATLFEAMEAAAAFFEAQLCAEAGKAGLDYLLGRGLTEETIARFRLGWAPDGAALKTALMGARFPEALLLEAGLLRRGDDGQVRDLFRRRAMFPITDRRGRVIGFGGRVIGDGLPKYINSPATPIFDKSALLYGLAHAREAAAKSGRAALVEGYLDVISMHQAGLGYAVAPLGTAVTEQQIGELWKLADEPVVCLDGDKAGHAAMVRAADRAIPMLTPGQSLRFATLPPKDDPDSLIRSGGVAAMQAVIDAARPMADCLWDMALSACPPDTPERAAALERSLYARAATIADEEVRRAYLSDFRRRLRDNYGPPIPWVLIGRRKDSYAARPFGDRLDLEWEAALAAAEAGPVRKWIEDQGLTWGRLVEDVGGLGFARGKAVKGRWMVGDQWPAILPPALWEPSAEGESLVLIPEWDGQPGESPLLDLIGWNPRTGDLHQRSGFGHVLGGWLVEEARAFDIQGLSRPVQVAGSPLSWLRRITAGEKAVLIVDWRRAWDALGGLSGLIADSVELGGLLDKHVRPPRLPRPKIMVEVGEG